MPHAHKGHDAARSSAWAVLTVSDTRTADNDTSGAAIRRLLEREGQSIVDHRILPDEAEAVGAQVAAWLERADCDGVIVTGGTGISRRDRTFEALDSMLDKRIDGFGELFRYLSYEQIGSAAMMSRAVAGVARGKPVFSLPGSTAAVELAMERLILPELGHLLSELRKHGAC